VPTADSNRKVRKLDYELWRPRNTRTQSAPLRCSVTEHSSFFSSPCHLSCDARLGVQDLVVLLGEPPVESPAPAPPAAGFFASRGRSTLQDRARRSSDQYPNLRRRDSPQLEAFQLRLTARQPCGVTLAIRRNSPERKPASRTESTNWGSVLGLRSFR
jgi:hypothetical protein